MHRQRLDLVGAGMEEGAVGIEAVLVGRQDGLLDDAQCLGLDDPGLAVLQAVEEDGTDQVGVEGRDGPEERHELFQRRLSLHPARGTQLQDEVTLVRPV